MISLSLHLKYVKLIHAVKVLQLLFVVKMACVVMKILYTMQLSIMPMNANVFVLIISQVRSNIDYYMGKLMGLTHLIS